MNLGKENFEINAFCMQLINILDIDQITIKITWYALIIYVSLLPEYWLKIFLKRILKNH